MLYPLTIFFWSIATLCLGLSTGLVMLIILRMTVGLFEVPSFHSEPSRAACRAVIRLDKSGIPPLERINSTSADWRRETPLDRGRHHAGTRTTTPTRARQ
jgi:hypothetical protein